MPNASPAKPKRLPPAPRPIKPERIHDAWNVITKLTSVSRAEALIKRMIACHREQHGPLAALLATHLASPRFSAGPDANVMAWNMLMSAACALEPDSEMVSETSRNRLRAAMFAQAGLALPYVHRHYDRLLIIAGVDAHLSLMGDLGIQALEPFLGDGVGWEIRQGTIQQIIGVLSARPLGLHTPVGEVGERLVTMVRAYAHRDVLIMPELVSLCANAYVATVLMGFDPDRALTRRALRQRHNLGFLVLPLLQEVRIVWKKRGYRGTLAKSLYEICALWEQAEAD